MKIEFNRVDKAYYGSYLIETNRDFQHLLEHNLFLNMGKEEQVICFKTGMQPYEINQNRFKFCHETSRGRFIPYIQEVLDAHFTEFYDGFVPELTENELLTLKEILEWYEPVLDEAFTENIEDYELYGDSSDGMKVYKLKRDLTALGYKWVG